MINSENTTRDDAVPTVPAKLNSDTILGAVVLALLIALVGLAFAGGYKALFGNGAERTLTAVFADSQALRQGDPVRIHGVAVGQVTGIARDRDGHSSTVTLGVDSTAPAVYRNARAILRWRTLLGATLYVDLEPGSPEAGPLPAHNIPLTQTQIQVEIENVVDTLQSGERRGAATLIGQMAVALSDAPAVGHVTRTLSAISQATTRGAGALRGSVRDTDLQELVTTAATTAASLDAPNAQLRSLVSGTAQTLLVTAARQHDVAATIAQLPGVMTQTHLTLNELNHTLSLADPVLALLQQPAPQVAPTIQQVRGTVERAGTLLNDATPLLHSLRPAVTALAHMSAAGVPLLTALEPSLTRLNGTILPYLNQVDPQTKHTAAEMIGPTLAELGGAAGQTDVNGGFIRFPASTGNNPVYLPCQILFGDPDSSKLITCNTLKHALQTVFSYNAAGPHP
jgi:virulence factor Mce-like protein